MSTAVDQVSKQKRKRSHYNVADLNQHMHRRNIYRNNRPDFKELAQQDLDFKPYVQYKKDGNAYIDFKDADASRALTKCLFKKDFNLDVDLPKDTLCPPIPNRLNYILWIEDLLSDSHITTGDIRGIDIGVGASCVYPLLGCATNKSWLFVGTDINQASVQSASSNVQRNHLQNRIKIFHNIDSSKILPLDELEHEGVVPKGCQFSFSMCNPPFFANVEEVRAGNINKMDDPAAVCTGTENEMITEGGESVFVTKMVKESLQWRDRIKWYTTMIGKRETLIKIKQEMKDNHIDNYNVTEFNQGHTKRWGFAWSFGKDRVTNHSDDAPVAKKLRQVQGPKTQFNCLLPTSPVKAQDALIEILNDLEAKPISSIDRCITGSMFTNTWSRKARRQRALHGNSDIKADIPMAYSEELFSFKLDLEDTSDEGTNLIATWTKGERRELFEGFWNHVKKRIEQSFGIVHGDMFGLSAS